MRRVFLVVLALVFLASPMIAGADDQPSLISKLNTILEQFRTGYEDLTIGLTELQEGQANLSLAQIELSQGLDMLYEAGSILHAEQQALKRDAIALNEGLNSLQTSFSDYVYATNEEFARLEVKNRRQKIGFIVGGGFLGGLAIISIYMGGK